MGLLEGRVALITGSTRGIGRAMAQRFSAEGARVVVNGRSAEATEKAAADLPGAFALAADMADASTVAEAVALAQRVMGRIDILVNNAAISSRAAITRLTDLDWDQALQVNLSGPMYVTRAVVPFMKAQHSGVIINVISGAGVHGTVGYSAYGASKGGLLALTMTLAQELAGFGIRVNALSPSALTDMMRQNPPEVLATFADTLPTVEAVSGAALFLASDLSSTVNGQVLSASFRLPD